MPLIVKILKKDPLDKLEESDLVVLNTCCVRENAEDRLFGKLGEVKKIKEKNKKTKEEGIMKDADKDFYTRSMDLSDEDFMSDDFQETKLPLWVKLLILILMIAIAAVAGYYISQNM